MFGSDDITFCMTNCNRKNCKRNLGYYKPSAPLISMAMFDEDCLDVNHKDCKEFYKISERT